MQQPSSTLFAPQSLGKTVKVRLTWPAAVDASGIARYELHRKKGSYAWVGITLPALTATAVDVPVAPGASYRFRLRAHDGAGNIGAWVTTPSATVRLRQETSGAITYSGSWIRSYLSGASGGYVRKTGVAGRSATFTFTGSRVAFVSTRAPSRGRAEVWLDGTKLATLDLYAPSRQTKGVVWAATVTATTHRVQIRVLGTKQSASSSTRVDLDAFLIYP